MAPVSKSFGSDQNIGVFDRDPLVTDSAYPLGFFWISLASIPPMSFVLVSNSPATWEKVGPSVHDKGYFIDLAALTTAYPVGQSGDWAILGTTDTVWVWDTATESWLDTGDGGRFLKKDQTVAEHIFNGVPFLDAEADAISDPYHLVNKAFLDKRVRGGGGFVANVFFRTDLSDKPSEGDKYRRIDYLSETPETELSIVVKASDGNVLARTYLYDGPLNTSLLEPGIYAVNYRAKVSSSVGNTQLGFSAFVLRADNSESVLFTSWSDEINNTDFLTLRKESDQPYFVVNPTDRFGVRIYARTTLASNVTITTVVGGPSGSYFFTPISYRHNLLRNRDAFDAHPSTSITQFTTLASLKASAGNGNAVTAFCIETDTLYRYTALGSVFTPNDLDICITSNGGNTRWIGVAGKYRAGLHALLGYDTTDTGDNIQDNGLVLDGPVNVDKQLLFKENGVNHWAIQGGWRNEKGEFFYLYNLISGANILVISQNGRWSINKPTNILLEHAAFSGTGLNDLIPSGIYTARITRGFNVEIDGTAPDTFKWSVSTDGITFVSQATLVPIVAGPIELGWGLSITFGAISGHTLGDKWAFRAHPQDALDTITVKPPMIGHVFTFNGSTFEDWTYTASTSHCSLSTVFPILSTTNHILYLGNKSPFNSSNYLLASAGAGVTVVVEYWNGSSWVALGSGESLIDETSNFTSDGSIKWDKSRFPLWAASTINGVTAFWIRIKTSSTPTTAPIVNAITRHGSYRFAVYSAYNDTRRIFSVRGNGISEMFEADRTSTSESFRQNEYITEKRLQAAVGSLAAREAYFTSSSTLEATLPVSSFSKAQSIGAVYTPVTIDTFIADSAHGNNIIAGDKYRVYAYLQRSLSASNRPISFYAELWRYTGAGAAVALIGTSNVIAALLSTNIAAYDFTIPATAKTMAATDKLAIRIIAIKPSVYTNAQTVTFWGGGTYASKLVYPSSAVTSNRAIYTSEQTNSYVLALSDSFTMVDFNKSTALTCTVPKNSVVAFPIGTEIRVRQSGAGQLTIAPVDGDVTLQYPDGLKTTKRYANATLLKIAENTWAVNGMLEA